MNALGHERDRPKQKSANDFGAHHRAAWTNHNPGFTLTLLVPLPKKRCGWVVGSVAGPATLIAILTSSSYNDVQ
jgi:hypothetical protein